MYVFDLKSTTWSRFQSFVHVISIICSSSSLSSFLHFITFVICAAVLLALVFNLSTFHHHFTYLSYLFISSLSSAYFIHFVLLFSSSHFLFISFSSRYLRQLTSCISSCHSCQFIFVSSPSSAYFIYFVLTFLLTSFHFVNLVDSFRLFHLDLSVAILSFSSFHFHVIDFINLFHLFHLVILIHVIVHCPCGFCVQSRTSSTMM